MRDGDISDEWIEVEFEGKKLLSGDTNCRYISEYTDFSVWDITEYLEEFIEEAENAGLENCRVSFRSTIEPYENFCGPVQVIVIGDRKLTEREKLDRAEEDADISRAEDMGLTMYEYKIYKKIKKMGIVEDV